MKKLLCLMLALMMCVPLLAGCGQYDMESADLESFVTLGNIDSFSYNDLAAYYQTYRAELGRDLKKFYMSTGYTVSMELAAEIQNDNGTFSPYAPFTQTVENYDVYRNTDYSLFDTALVYALDDASAEPKTPRLIELGSAFSFTIPVSNKEINGEAAGKTLKLTVTITKVLPTEYTDSVILEDLQSFYSKYASEKEIIEMGDSVQIDFVGKIDGVKFSGGTGDDFVFVVGEGGFVEGFEEQLVGHKNGEKFKITVTFPADYEEAELAGKEATFDIKVDEVANDSAIIEDNTPFKDIFELKEYYRVWHYTQFAIVDYVADISTLKELPEELVKDFEEIYQNYVNRSVAEAIVTYAEAGEEYTKAEMKEKLYPNGSDKTFVEERAKDAAYNYILIHLLMKKLDIVYLDEAFERDVKKVAEQENTTVKELKKRTGEEILRMSFMDVMVAEKLMERIADAPEFKDVSKN